MVVQASMTSQTWACFKLYSDVIKFKCGPDQRTEELSKQELRKHVSLWTTSLLNPIVLKPLIRCKRCNLALISEQWGRHKTHIDGFCPFEWLTEIWWLKWHCFFYFVFEENIIINKCHTSCPNQINYSKRFQTRLHSYLSIYYEL